MEVSYIQSTISLVPVAVPGGGGGGGEVGGREVGGEVGGEGGAPEDLSDMVSGKQVFGTEVS